MNYYQLTCDQSVLEHDHSEESSVDVCPPVCDDCDVVRDAVDGDEADCVEEVGELEVPSFR